MRVKSWNFDIETTCLLCGLSDENIDHLFFIAIILGHVGVFAFISWDLFRFQGIGTL